MNEELISAEYFDEKGSETGREIVLDCDEDYTEIVSDDEDNLPSIIHFINGGNKIFLHVRQSIMKIFERH